MVHCTFEFSATTIGEEVTIGHSAIIHGCEIHDQCLIGMGAVVMDKAVVQKNVIVAANSVVLANTVLESGYLYAGAPVKKIKPLSEQQIADFKGTADHYLLYGSWYKDTL